MKMSSKDGRKRLWSFSFTSVQNQVDWSTKCIEDKARFGKEKSRGKCYEMRLLASDVDDNGNSWSQILCAKQLAVNSL